MRKLTAFVMHDDYTTIAVYRQADGSESYENTGYLGELFEPGGLYGLAEVLQDIFPAVPQVEEVEAVGGAVPDSAELVPDVEMLGDDGDPGDRILPEDMVSSGDPIEDEDLTEDIFDLCEGKTFSATDGEVYAAYFVQAGRNPSNPYGSRDSYAGIAPTFQCRLDGDCDTCHQRFGQVPDLWGVLEHDTPCRRVWERHPISWEDSTVRTISAFFQVIAVLPRRIREGQFKVFRGRDGKLRTVQMKDRPNVIVRWGDLNERGEFIPGVENPDTGERLERISVMPAWALYNIRTGEPFNYEEPAKPVRLNTEFRRRVLAEAVARNPALWQRIEQPRHLGIRWWRVIKDGDKWIVEAVLSQGKDVIVLNPGMNSPLARFALQAISWREIEEELVGLSRR